MKVRVLYPTAFEGTGKKNPDAGDLVEVDEKHGKALIAEGFAEPHNAKPKIERATKAPGEKK